MSAPAIALASGPEPEGYEARRLVLEGLLELRASAIGGDLTISGKLPFPPAEVKKNCEDRLVAARGELSCGHLRVPFRTWPRLVLWERYRSGVALEGV